MREYLYRVITGQVSGFVAAIVKFFLYILSLIFGVIINVRNLLIERGNLQVIDLGKPVISVGNITWGGVGKTPFVIFLVEYFSAHGLKSAILTRGYMKNVGRVNTLSDEALMLKQQIPDIPVGVGADRVSESRKILRDQPVDVFILDDGFQHRKVKRDIDIVLIDTTNPFGNNELIPAGILREPLSALKRAQIIVLTKTDLNLSAAQVLEERLRKINNVCPIAWAVHSPSGLVDLFGNDEEQLIDLRGKRVVSFCSIGDPKSFEESLNTTGALIDRSFIFPDHHVYLERDIQKIIAHAQQTGIEILVTTAKDSVKILQFQRHFTSCRCLILKIKIELRTGKNEVFKRIDHLLGR
ncbi:MAG: tetraacyldisaccharide 4'-kinase [Candidatus Omnitrophica bacterium]|nr:tetraacyldisaccharide 4'-kinase [Candidatus Omnitrophota bacterium]